MTLNELARIALEKYYAEPYDAHDVACTEVHNDMKIAVLAVLDEVKRAMPDYMPSIRNERFNGWNECLSSVKRQLDEMSK